ncbi:hypothetical protein [Nocardia vinacea]|uniref:hypothetical protein n=1 Tax=Nocardia vinacea TaxID=96468 RepID=UPI000302DBE7|nr:hypothetical protein [Nocardia vinacea]
MSFLGFGLKDLVVTAVSVVPGVGAPLAGLTDGIWTGIEEGSVSKGLQAGATTWAMSSIPGGKLVGGVLAKVGGKVAEKVASKAAADSLVGKGFDWVANHSVTVPNKWYLPKSGKTFGGLAAKGVGRSAGRAGGRAAGAWAGSRLDEAGWWPGNGGGGGDKTVTIATRPAGADIKGAYYGAKDSKAIVGDYNEDGKSQQPYKVLS